MNSVLATTGLTGALNNDAINVMKKMKGESGHTIKETSLKKPQFPILY